MTIYEKPGKFKLFLISLFLLNLTGCGLIFKQDIDEFKVFNKYDDEEVFMSTSYSDPHPVVKLGNIKIISVKNNTARIKVSGTVTDNIMDITEANAAIIKQVIFEHDSPPYVRNSVIQKKPETKDSDALCYKKNNLSESDVKNLSQPTFENGIKTVPAKVTYDEILKKSDWSPYARKGNFSTQLTVPLKRGNVEVSVKASNLIENTGYDSFSILVKENGPFLDECGNPVDNTGGVINRDSILGIIEHENTGPGLVNLIRVEGNNNSATIFISDLNKMEVGPTEEPMLLDVNEPLMAVSLGKNKKNINLEGISNLFELKYDKKKDWENGISISLHSNDFKDKQKKIIHWNYTTHSPVNYFKYAAGTTVKHIIKSSSFLDMEQLDENDIQPMKKENNKWVLDPSIKIKKVEKTEDFEKQGGYQITMHLSKEAWENHKKHLKIEIVKDDTIFGGLKNFFNPDVYDRYGYFEVVKLKTVILAVDGLAYLSIDEAMKLNKAPTFKKLFNKSTNRDNPALAALPTITFTNWPGVFSGYPPSKHGILGNAFFSREQKKMIPFGSAVSSGVFSWTNSSDNLSVVNGALNELSVDTNPRGSIYKKIADIVDNQTNVWSVHAFYTYPGQAVNPFNPFNTTSRDNNLSITSEYFDNHPIYSFHNGLAASVLDKSTANHAKIRWESHVNIDNKNKELDILTAYFSGPDNVAHAIGEKKQDSWLNLNRNNGYTEGPQLPEVDKPLMAIKDHIEKETDAQVEKVVNAIDESGYLYATLFVLVADHGLHAVKNEEDFIIQLSSDMEKPGIEKLFESAPLNKKVWGIKQKDSPAHDISTKNVVYSPNGGMAHIYLKNDNKEWTQPPKKADIEDVAGLLYIEAIGKKSSNNTEGFVSCGPSGLKPPCYKEIYKKFKGALGYPPAIFGKIPVSGPITFTTKYKWLEGVDQVTGNLEWKSVADFIQSSPRRSWPEFEARLEEMNSSRSGDIVIFMNGKKGYLTVPKGDELNGWHGGATISESEVPLMFNIFNTVDDSNKFLEKALNSTLEKAKLKEDKKYSIFRTSTNLDNSESLKKGLEKVNGKSLRNWQLGDVLEAVYSELYGGKP